ncbi:hypothetical protein GA0070616_4630 [Micromonospora nigra]|uniref:Uncharacterized protein n=1 Tax=Micromonospora nigra TaxID=145857 RepID=A0A1C6SV01_9ACTN|nr:hypothetical protein [Micromonospora nigra]SCL33083.1 hypothetical protein GA0070616_4630 [Micromonospora nigra]
MTQEIKVNVFDRASDTTREMRVEPSWRDGGEGHTFFGIDSKSVYIDLAPAAVRELGAWLVERYGLAGWSPKRGDRVRIASGAVDAFGDTPALYGATLGEVTAGVDSDGDVQVKFLDGAHPGVERYMLPKFLTLDVKDAAPAPAPAPVFAAGTPVVIVTDDARGWAGTPARLAKGTPAVVVELSDDDATRGYVIHAMRDGALVRAHVRPSDVALTLPAETATPSAPAALKVGDVVELKPGAETEHGGGVYFKPDVTRVKVEEVPSYPGGNFIVSNVNGSGTEFNPGTGKRQYVSREFLGDPIPAAERPWAVGDEAIVTEGGVYADGFRTGERVRLTYISERVDPRDGSRQVRAASATRPDAGWYTRTSVLRRP